MSIQVSPAPPAQRDRDAPSPAGGARGVPQDVVRQLLVAARQNGVRRLLVRTPDVEIEIELDRAPPTAAPAGPPPTAGEPAQQPEVALVDVLAPAVGVVRLTTGANGSIGVGAVVGPDDQVAQIEVMKMTMPVLAGHAGTVHEVCVRDGDVVEFHQPLVRLAVGGGNVPDGSH